jgi:predicted ABC-type ATPase
MKEILILGGPNGAGKTTVARVLLPVSFPMHEYLNADEIAREISPRNVDASAFAAGRLMIERMREFVSQGRSFAFETTCAGQELPANAAAVQERRMADHIDLPVGAVCGVCRQPSSA